MATLGISANDTNILKRFEFFMPAESTDSLRVEERRTPNTTANSRDRA